MSHISDMLSSWMTTAVRVFRREWLYPVVNVLGLSLGMASCILILLFARHELSFDRHHPASERTYRLVLADEPRVPSPLVSIVGDDVTGIERAALFRRPFRPMIVHGDKRRYEAIHVASQGFFQILSFPFLHGDPQTALQEVGSIVVTPVFAERYFDRTDVVGETILWDGTIPYKITAVVEIPATSHLAFEAAISYKTMLALDGFGYSEIWRYRQSAYVVLSPGSNTTQALGHILDAVERRLGADRRESLEAEGLALQPVTDIRLHSDWPIDTARTGSRTRLILLVAIAAVILTMGCANFASLAAARSSRRVREFGLRKVLGARRWQQVMQLLTESAILGGAALIVATAASWTVLPVFSDFLHVELVLEATPETMASLIAIGLLGSFLAGVYPAFLLSATPTARAFRSTAVSGRLRIGSGLVIFQFAAAIGLIAASLLLHKQMEFVRTTDLGFNREQIVFLQTGYPGVQQRRHLLIDRLQSHPAISAATAVRHVPSEDLEQRGMFRVAGTEIEVPMPFTSSDPGFPDLFRVPLLAGRDHDEPYDRRHDDTYLVTVSAARALGFESPEQIVGRRLDSHYRGRDQEGGTVIGVLADFHFETLHRPAGPLVIANRWGTAYVAARLADVPEGVAHLQQTWDQLNPDWPLSYRFLDDDFEEAYRTETRLGAVLVGFAAIALLIAGIGVFALAAYTAQQRAREVGIRRVLGASTSSIAVLLGMDFVRLCVVASVAAVPIAYVGMTHWLERFAYRVEPGWEPFGLGVAFVLLLAMVTTSGHALRAAWTNPVNVLRDG